jgi:pimeloyl-ACP methyl ester carboxylesterase
VKTTFLFVHSPLVGVLTWSLVAQHVQQRGYACVVPALSERIDSMVPFWKQHAESVSRALAHLPSDQRLTLVAHSGAGPLLPAIRAALPNPVDAYIFVDAGIPRDGASRLDLIKLEGQAWAQEFHQELLQGGRFPTWRFEDLEEVLPDEALRRQMVAEIQPRDLAFFSEPITVSRDWPDAPCAYIQLSEGYEFYAEQARASGWWVKVMQAAHFHMLVDAAAVADAVIEATEALTRAGN